MEFHRANVASCHNSSGTVVVVDVLRAFTTTAFAFERGAAEIILVSTVDEAFSLRAQNPDFLLMGEVDGLPVDGFDLPNSPSAMETMDLRSRHLIMRTTAGTQGVIASRNAEHILVASLTVANATAKRLRELHATQITFVDTGVRAKGGGEEDAICSDYIISILNDSPLSGDVVRQTLMRSKAARKFASPDDRFPKRDLTLAGDIDRFDFAMQVERVDGRNCLRRLA